jgi:hypothetical protein
MLNKVVFQIYTDLANGDPTCYDITKFRGKFCQLKPQRNKLTSGSPELVQGTFVYRGTGTG